MHPKNVQLKNKSEIKKNFLTFKKQEWNKIKRF